KNFLFEMLKTKFKVKKTEKSFNTPMGITKAILTHLDFSDEILILEFGADHNHDIKKLCTIVQPDDAIITGVTFQHLQTFKTFENIINTKYELVENTKKDGNIVFNADNGISKNFFDICKNKNKFLVSTNKNNPQICLWAEKIKCEFNKTSFYLCTQTGKVFCTTKLLGKNNVTNILLSAQMALNFGVNLLEIKKVVKSLSPAPHRLNLIENAGKYILDDSFNANPEGVKNAIDVLLTFKGKKIVITPGLVELGTKQFEENVKLGESLKKVDYVLITNQTNKTALLKGLFGSKNHVFCFENLLEATQKLQEIFFVGDCVLFLNDLPDNYA
ncbi:MAG: Mur ligase family protein, partial [Christensenellales bacterium]